MTGTRIKICGITGPEDALSAGRLGADAIGLVFHPPSPRSVNREQARQILAALPPFVTPVLLFVDAESRLILDLAEDLRVNHVQLHGSESPQQVAELRSLRVIKAVRVDEALLTTLNMWREAIASQRLTNLAGLLLETASRKGVGGTGEANNWPAILQAKAAGAFDDLPPLIAAGGLTPENVGPVVTALRPYAVDVSSGVESATGRKSDEKMAEFIRQVRRADQA